MELNDNGSDTHSRILYQ